MKIIISESRLNNTIINYLDKNFYPDYGWPNQEFVTVEIYRYGSYDFYINDKPHYTFSVDMDDGISELYVRNNTIEPLTDLFGDFWIPVFKEWFEKNTGLKVDSMIDGQINTLI